MKFFIHLDSNMSNPDLIEITTLKYSGKILLKVRIEDLCQNHTRIGTITEVSLL